MVATYTSQDKMTFFTYQPLKREQTSKKEGKNSTST
jgi:hypothetical protein